MTRPSDVTEKVTSKAIELGYRHVSRLEPHTGMIPWPDHFIPGR